MTLLTLYMWLAPCITIVFVLLMWSFSQKIDRLNKEIEFLKKYEKYSFDYLTHVSKYLKECHFRYEPFPPNIPRPTEH